MDPQAIAQHALTRLETAEWKPSPAGTRYAIIDGLLPDGMAHEIAASFDPTKFALRSSFRERKRTSCNLDRHPPLLADACRALHSPEMVRRITEITGITGLEPDPTLYAGGLSLMQRGDFLNPHIDNSHDGKRRRYRRINLLYYATPGWGDNDGGHLRLWDTRVLKPFQIHSSFNRLVLMETNRTSWHSVSPVRGDGFRRCISSYYFSPQSPSGEEYYHVTSFTGRPEQPVRRAIGALDNAARNLARKLGATREADKGYTEASAHSGTA